MVMDGFGHEDEGARSRWLKIGGGVLAGVVLLAAGFGVGRVSAPAATGGGQQRASVSAASGPGPTRVENGVPVGYAHTPEGAVAAATNFETVMSGSLIAQPNKFAAAVGSMVAPDATDKLRLYGQKGPASFQQVMGLVSYAQQGRMVVFRAIPIAYHLDRYGDKAAQVSMWVEVMVAIDGAKPLQETWATDVYGLEWVSGDWKLATTDGGSEGPTPVIAQSPVTTSQLPVQLRDFKPYRHDAGG
jgi:hypothetical protein